MNAEENFERHADEVEDLRMRFERLGAGVRADIPQPLSDRFEVVPRTHGSVFTIVGDFATRGGPITNVKPSDLCALGAG